LEKEDSETREREREKLGFRYYNFHYLVVFFIFETKKFILFFN
jgi:hypothetical protein